MKPRGYRSGDAALLTGPWLPGELLGLPPAGRPATAEPTRIPEPRDPRDELCVLPGAGFFRFVETDWVGRTARLEIGLADAASGSAREALDAALAHARGVLNLHRVHGLATPAAGAPTELLGQAGLRREAVIPDHVRLGGRTAAREIWAVVFDD